MTNFASAPKQGSAFKFAIGLDGTRGLSNAGGDLPDVRVWNNNAEFVGMSLGGGKVEDGSYGAVTVHHENQGVYSLFSANGDAICIAWVTTTWSGSGNHYVVMGDMGFHCGVPWYYSGMHAVEQTRPPHDPPKCFWIDKNGDVPTTGFQVRWPAFSSSEVDVTRPAEELRPEQKCDGVSIGFRTEPDPSTINYWTSRVMRRSPVGKSELMGRPSRRTQAMKSQIVFADEDGLSARFLCESSTSVGPDLVNLEEELFCDMDDKKLYPLCGADSQSPCFDVNSQTLRDGIVSFDASSQASSQASPQVEAKAYTTTLDWRKHRDFDHGEVLLGDWIGFLSLILSAIVFYLLFLLRVLPIAVYCVCSTFEGDLPLLRAARTQARAGFEQQSGLDPSSKEATEAVLHAEGVAQVLRHNIVQGAATGDGSTMRLRIHKDTERGDNNTIKNPKVPGGTIEISAACSN
ncbi:hypothetical protein DV735_g251, partial [Chaetothyriales sp. CBS 134920]